MGVEFVKPSYSYGIVNAVEDGKVTGEIRYYVEDRGETITGHCQTHAWSDSIHIPASRTGVSRSFDHWDVFHVDSADTPIVLESQGIAVTRTPS